MSRIRSNQITNQAADGAPTVQHGLIISGVSTVTTLDLNGDLDVDGHTNLDNVNIAGVTTFSGDITATGDINANDHINLASGKKLSMAGDVFKIYHSTNAAIINESGDLLINQNVSNKDIKISTGSGPTERVRIDSNGFMGLGTNSPSSYNNKAYNFVISSSGHAGMTIAGGTSSDSSIYFADGTSGAAQYAGWVQYEHDNNALTFGVNATERVRIPSAGGIELKTDGKGIQFPTPQTPTNANTNRVGISSEMRYYESGTFVPGLSSTVLNGLQLPAFTDGSYTRRIGRYVRIGHLVHVTVEILMAGTVTYANGSTSTAPPCIVGVTPFKYTYSNRYAVSGQPDYYPCSISYSASTLTDDTLYAVLRRDYNAEARIEITKPGSGGSRQYNSTNFGEIFPANSHINVSCTYAIDTSNADF